MFLSYMICLVILYGWTLEHQENLKEQKLINSSEIKYFQLLYIFSLSNFGSYKYTCIFVSRNKNAKELGKTHSKVK